MAFEFKVFACYTTERSHFKL